MVMPKEVVYTTDDQDRWNSVLPIQESVFGSVEFAGIVQKHLGYQAALYVLQDHTGLIAYPFFFRSMHSLSVGQEGNSPLSDTVSPEFTGPLARGAAVQSLAIEFAKRFSTFALNRKVVTEFIHLHPWKAFTDALLKECLQFNRENVRVFEAQTMGDIREFHRLYVQTMKGRNALKHYYYPLDYFSTIFEHLRGSARFVLAGYKNQMVAGTLYLHDRHDVYSNLCGADMNFQHLRPTNAVIYDTILWGQREGKRRLILGGGYLPNDGVFRFKASFSPETARFFVYKRVHLPEKYAALCRYWSSSYGQDLQATAYFPPYRFLPNSSFPQDPSRAAFRVGK